MYTGLGVPLCAHEALDWNVHEAWTGMCMRHWTGVCMRHWTGMLLCPHETLDWNVIMGTRGTPLVVSTSLKAAVWGH